MLWSATQYASLEGSILTLLSFQHLQLCVGTVSQAIPLCMEYEVDTPLKKSTVLKAVV